MNRIFYLALSAVIVLASCSKEDEIITPPAPNKYTLTITAEAGGTVSSPGGTYNEGSKITVTATPDALYLFKEWSDGSTDNPREITVTSNLNLKASFIKKTYPLAVTIEGEGTVQEEVIIQGSTSETTYNAGTTVRLTATPNESWVFAGWSGDAESKELEIEVSIEKGMAVTATFRPVSNPERYSEINETTSFSRAQQKLTNYLSKEYIQNTVKVEYDGECQWLTFHRNLAILDLDNDGKLDVLGFANSFCDNEDYAARKGKFIFISDYLGASIKQVYDSEHYYGSGDMTINDYDNDGDYEVLFFATDAKTNLYNPEEDYGGGTNIPPKAPALLDYKNGLTVNYYGEPADSSMGTSGDIDNDGDIDFIQWAQPTVYNNESIEFTPNVQLNDGDLNFTAIPLVLDYPADWSATSAELFDLNGDGFLDLIAGWRIGVPKWNDIFPNFFNAMRGPRVLYGNGTGQFSLSNSIELVETTLSSKNIAASVLGYGFTDYDLDGDIDIVLTTTRDEPGGTFEDGTYYDNYYLVFFENQNGTYIDVTESVIQGSFNQTQEFPNFYKVRLIDVDQDGDIDIIPDAIANWGPINYSPSLHWKKENGVFVRSY